MKHIATAIALSVASLALVSCGGKKEAEVAAETGAENGSETETEAGAGAGAGAETAAAPASHPEITDGVVAMRTIMMTEMSKIKDAATADAFAGKVAPIKSKMKGYLEAAQGLDAPTAEEKASFKSKMDAAKEKAVHAMLAMMMGMSQNPDADAIAKVLEGAMNDYKMDKVMEALEGIYEIEDAGGESAPAQAAAKPAPTE